ncbi:hypothetical protein NliqN6_3969 [Naganishia liquefaciens]|uniref:EF-hand domain-containing protein n=1 Tax=Naganishia liquefaciens TaxID=104408 RepID=A0A8H3YGU7_9TREE|nr:hypothetical protein NliqN6_3969 [Naganishia liquefaciens]
MSANPVSDISSATPPSTGGILSTLTHTLKEKAKPSDSELTRWRKTFDAFAKVEKDGKRFLDADSFIDAIAPSEDFSKIKRAQYGVLFKVADINGRGLVSWEDFTVFETLLKRPDADYQIAFQYFDTDSSGTISFDEFKEIFSQAIGAGSPDAIPFDFDCDWVKLYLGKRGGSQTHVLGYTEFGQLIKGLQGERLRQAFRHFDADGDGYIKPDEFQKIIMEIAGHKLSDSVLERLPTLCTLSPGQRISYSEVIAFHNVVREMDNVEAILRAAIRKSKDGRIDMADFLNEAAESMRYGHFTPMEANIIWHFATRGQTGTYQRLTTSDFDALLDPKWQAPSHRVEKAAAATSQGFLIDFLHSTYNFALGGLAGGLGAIAVYPIDLVKTRLQNQRSTVVGEVLYKNPWDCVKKVYTNEGGVRAFYRGVLPQLVGVAPEKALKLTVNDFVRSKTMDPETGRISLFWELIAGGAAGGSQVIVTNPLEIIKIRLQLMGEMAKLEGPNAPRKGAMHVVRSLGLLGLYQGASACLARDIPFSMIYFTAYAHLKKDFFGEGRNGKQLSFGELLLAASIAGMPSAYLTTPFDCVKTRLQAERRAGQTHYKGLIDALITIPKEEGFKALFKGGIARVIRSSPQFGVTLVTYELLKKNFPFPYGDYKPVASSLAEPQDMSRVRARNALKILLDTSSRFGQPPTQSNMSALPKMLRPA